MQRIKEQRAKENVGALIRKSRIEKRISQSELSKAVGLSRTFINLMENGQRAPSYNTLERMTQYLGVSLDSIIMEAEEGSHDPEIRLPYLLAKLLKSRDTEKLNKLLNFVESLE